MEFNKEDLLKEIKGLISDNLKGTITEKELNERMADINKQLEVLNNKEDNHAEVKELSDNVEKLVKSLEETNIALKEQGSELKQIKESGLQKKNEQPKTFRDALKAAFLEKKDALLKEVNDDYGKRLSLKEFIESGRPSPKMTIKSAVDMLESNIARVPNLFTQERDSSLHFGSITSEVVIDRFCD